MKKGPPRILFTYSIEKQRVNARYILSRSVRRFMEESILPNEEAKSIPAGATLSIGNGDGYTCPLGDIGLVVRDFPLLTCLEGEYYLLVSANMTGVIELCRGDERILDERAFAALGLPIDRAFPGSNHPQMVDKLYLIHLVVGSRAVIMIGLGILCFSVTPGWSQISLDTLIPESAVPPLTKDMIDYRIRKIAEDKKATLSTDTAAQPKAN